MLAVDHGTTATVGAVADLDPADGWVRVTTVLVDGAPSLPSVVMSRPDGAVLAGRPALDAAPADPAAAVLRTKSFLASSTGTSSDPVVTTWPRPTTAVDVATALIARVFHTEASRRGTLPESVVLTHPAGWGDGALDALRAAGRAVLDAVPGDTSRMLTLLPAAEAAAVRLGGEGPVVVCDVGGGGTEVAVVDRDTDGSARVRPGSRTVEVGGEALDDALAQTVLDRARPELASRIRFGGDLDAHRAWFLLRLRVRDAKERLGAAGSTTIELPVLPPESPGPQTVTLTQADLASHFAPGLEEIATTLLGVVDGAGADAGAGVTDRPPLLVRGGVSALPGVRDWLGRRTGLALAHGGDTGAVSATGVASGASAWAAAREGLGQG